MLGDCPDEAAYPQPSILAVGATNQIDIPTYRLAHCSRRAYTRQSAYVFSETIFQIHNTYTRRKVNMPT